MKKLLVVLAFVVLMGSDCDEFNQSNIKKAESKTKWDVPEVGGYIHEIKMNDCTFYYIPGDEMVHSPTCHNPNHNLSAEAVPTSKVKCTHCNGTGYMQ